MVRALKFGIRDMPDVPFKHGLELSDIPQTKKDKAFALDYLESGVQSGIYEEISSAYAQ